MKTIRINTSSPYDVIIGTGALDLCGTYASQAVTGRETVIISDDTVNQLYGSQVEQNLRQVGFRVQRFVFSHGEAQKNLQTLTGVLEFLAEQHLTRSDLIIALGGGVVGDLAGLAAAIYLRGIRFMQIPTTLLAAVDSSVGGKSAVDLRAGKNLAGAFWQPSAVLCDPQTLGTLPAETLADGVSEALKCGMIFDQELFERIAQSHASIDWDEIIFGCVDWKRRVVERDEHDTGERQLLNFGHTLGHAIERCSGYRISHGHAVAVGMLLIARSSWEAGFSEENCAPEIRDALVNWNLPISCQYTADQLFNAALSDKKRLGDTLTFVLPKRPGCCVLQKMAVSDFRAFIQLGLDGQNE